MPDFTQLDGTAPIFAFCNADSFFILTCPNAVHRGQATLSHLAPRSDSIRSYQSRIGSDRKQDVSGWAGGTRTRSCYCTRRTASLRTYGKNPFDLFFKVPSPQSAELPQFSGRFTQISLRSTTRFEKLKVSGELGQLQLQACKAHKASSVL